MGKLLIFLIVTVCVLALDIFVIVQGIKERDLACEELGFKDYKYIEGMNFCRDVEDNLHYIHIECKPWYWVECTAKPISVGDVRVK